MQNTGDITQRLAGEFLAQDGEVVCSLDASNSWIATSTAVACVANGSFDARSMLHNVTQITDPFNSDSVTIHYADEELIEKLLDLSFIAVIRDGGRYG